MMMVMVLKMKKMMIQVRYLQWQEEPDITLTLGPLIFQQTKLISDFRIRYSLHIIWNKKLEEKDEDERM